MKFHQTQLANGLQVVAELNPAVHSVAIGFFVKTGARDETPDVSGVSHFLEHMIFKGTQRHSADDVNRIFDEVGARYNASTGEEVTQYYAAILPEYLPITFDLLADILQPSLREEDFDMEKNVILEEIGMYDDQHGFLAYEKSMQSHFNGHPLGQSILGSNETISALPCDKMQAYHRERYRAGNIVLAVAGNTEWPQVLELAEKHCGGWPVGVPQRDTSEADPQGGVRLITREHSVQQHVMELTKAPPARSSMRFAAELLSVIVGDDSGSRLYWDLVDPGLAELAELGYNEYDGSGTYLTYVSASPENVAEILRRIRTIYDEVNRSGVTEEELKLAKNKVSSRVVLRSERPMGRLASLGANWVYRDEYRSVADDLHDCLSVTTDDIRELLDAYPLGHTTTVGVGPLERIEV